MKNHNYAPENGVFINAIDAQERPREPGVFFHPAYSTPEEPPIPAQGNVMAFLDAAGNVPSDYQLGAWNERIDRRGAYWNVLDGQPTFLYDIGVDPADRDLTDKEPIGAVKWGGSDWVPDVEKLTSNALSRRDYFLSIAASKIAPLSDAVDLDMATADEVAQLTAWKRYRVELSRVPQQPDFPTSVTWPLAPGEPATE